MLLQIAWLHSFLWLSVTPIYTWSIFWRSEVFLYLFLLYSKGTQSHLFIHYFSLLMFHCVLSKETEYSSLCYSVGPHCLSILNVSVCIDQPQIPSPSHFLPLGSPHVCPLDLWVCFCSGDMFLCALSWLLHGSDVMWYLSLSFWLVPHTMITLVASLLLPVALFLSCTQLSGTTLYMCTPSSSSIHLLVDI